MENILYFEIKSNELSVLFYIAAIIVNTVFTTLFFVFAAKEKDDMRVSVRNFSLLLLLCVICDFMLTYFSQQATGMLPPAAISATMHISDIAYIFMMLCWVFAAENLMGGYKVVNRNALIACTVAYAVCAEMIVATATAAYGNEVRMSDGPLSNVLIVLNLAFDLFILCCGVLLIVRGMLDILRWKKRWRVLLPPVLFSLCLAYYMVGTSIRDYRLVSNGAVSSDYLLLINPASLISVILCELLLIFMHTKGYYIMGDEDPGRLNESDLENRCAALSEKCGLSARESEVLMLVIKGKSNATIAKELFISEYTVKRHLNTVYKKTGFSGRYELILRRI